MRRSKTKKRPEPKNSRSKGAVYLIRRAFEYSSAQKMIDALKIQKTWDEMAIILEDQLGWYPKEDRSVEELMEHAGEDDLKNLFQALSETPPDGDTENLRRVGGRRIYQVRNGLVHYRPAQHKIDYSEVNWNRLCEAMAGIIRDIYAAVFPN